MRPCSKALVVLAMLLNSCSGSDGGASGQSDASVQKDGAVSDSGVTERDGGAVFDADSDSGVIQPDGGVVVDAGSGVTEREAGVVFDASSCEASAPATRTACPAHAPDSGAVMACGALVGPSDACIIDSDCGDGGVCVCETPQNTGCGGVQRVLGNICLPSNCQDGCPCGVCKTDLAGCGVLGGYFCTTPLDECSSASDCDGGMCTYGAGRWVCTPIAPCPG